MTNARPVPGRRRKSAPFAPGLVLLAATSLAPRAALTASELPQAEFAARRAEAMRRMADGVLLLPSRTLGAGNLVQHGYLQDPNFFYFTNLPNAAGTVLAIDGAAKETWLFVPEKLPGLAGFMTKLLVPPGAASEKALGIDHVVPRKQLPAFLTRRQESPGVILYTLGGAETHGFPLDIALDDPLAAWNHAIEELWPSARLKPADAIVAEMRAIKSPAEIEVLRRVGQASAQALRAGMASVRPGRPQREGEAAVLTACIDAGAEGPSFWPWVMAGPTSAFPAPFESLADYRHLNRAMQAGEVARVDVGCDIDHYRGDVGRTVPVSGRFDAGQRETWDLLSAAYASGLRLFRDGAKRDDVFAASLAEVRRRQPSLATPLGKKAAEVLLAPDGLKFWEIHGVGLDGAEGMPEVLRAGMVVAFEPIFSVEGQGFYLEDMVLVTQDAHEVLTQGLPYSADEIERAARPHRRYKSQ